MIRTIRTAACLIVATTTALIGWVWAQAPHTSPSPARQLSATYNTGVGMVDLYILHDARGFDRLVEVDPGLTGIGGRAARAVAIDDHFQVHQRVLATKLLAEHQGLDESFITALASTTGEQGQATAFCAIQSTLDQRLGCIGS